MLRIRLSDLEPEIARRIASQPRAARIVSPDAVEDEGKVRPPRYKEISLLVAFLWLLLCWNTVARTSWFLFALLAPLGFYLMVRIEKRVYKRRLRRRFQNRAHRESFSNVQAVIAASEEISAPIFHTIFGYLFDLSRSQRLYGETLTLLLDLSAQGRIDDGEARLLLSRMNDLAAGDHELARQKATMEKAASRSLLRELEEKHSALTRRLEETQDPIAHGHIAQSLAMCAARLANMQALFPLMERIDAQREVVEQTLASLHAALTRMQIAPASDNHRLSFDTSQAQEMAAQINRQSRAVEEAVAEVASLRVGQ